MNVNTYEIEIAVDLAEAEQFAQWLNDRGHTAYVGHSTGSLVDGNYGENEREIFNALWEQYCNG